MNLHQQIEQWLITRNKSFQIKTRPFVTLTYAQSWDGSISSRRDEPLALSGTEATQLTHQLRSIHDGILVGIGTVLSDDPQLTVREWTGPNPQPIVLDSRLRMPATARLCHHPDKNCWVMTMHPTAGDLGDQVEIFSMISAEQEHVPLLQSLALMRDKGINSLMVEGGATIITAFLRSQMADALVLTVSPQLVGGYKAVGNLDTSEMQRLPRIHPMNTARLGEDLILWGDLDYEGCVN